jgi:hypothetical protein
MKLKMNAKIEAVMARIDAPIDKKLNVRRSLGDA